MVAFAGVLMFSAPPTSVAAPPDSFIVVYKDNIDVPAKTANLERRHGFTSDFKYQHAIKGFAAILPRPIREKIAKDPDVAFISPDGDAQAIAASVPVVANETVPTGALRIETAHHTVFRAKSKALRSHAKWRWRGSDRHRRRPHPSGSQRGPRNELR